MFVVCYRLGRVASNTEGADPDTGRTMRQAQAKVEIVPGLLSDTRKQFVLHLNARQPSMAALAGSEGVESDSGGLSLADHISKRS